MEYGTSQPSFNSGVRTAARAKRRIGKVTIHHGSTPVDPCNSEARVPYSECLTRATGCLRIDRLRQVSLIARVLKFPLHADSQECQYFVTQNYVYTFTRVLHRTTNAVTYLQSKISAIFTADLHIHALFWLEDIIVHHPNADGFLQAVRLLLELFRKNNIKLHPVKSSFKVNCINLCITQFGR